MNKIGKMKIYVDFDGTLLNTTRLKRAAFSDMAKEYNFTKKELLSSYKEECKSYCFSLVRYCQRLFESKSEAKKVFEHINKKYIYNSKKYLYKDVIPFLHQLDRTKYSVILLTLGDKKFQKDKVDHSGLIKYFDRVYYTEEQKWDFLADIHRWNERFVTVDDRADTTENIQKKFPRSLPIQIKRRSHDKDDPVANKKAKIEITSVATLAAAKKIVESL